MSKRDALTYEDLRQEIDRVLTWHKEHRKTAPGELRTENEIIADALVPQIKACVLQLITEEDGMHAEFCKARGEKYRECLQCVLDRICQKVSKL